jgi:hypothetical protein
LILQSAAKSLLYKTVSLPVNTDLYHLTTNGKLAENKDGCIYVTKQTEYLTKLDIRNTLKNTGMAYQFRNRIALQIPNKWDKRFLNSIKSCFDSAARDTGYPLKKRKYLQNMKDSFEEMFTGVYLDDGPDFRIFSILRYLSENTDFPEKNQYDGFYDDTENYDNYCIFEWKKKLDIIGCMPYKDFIRKNQSKS